MKIIINSIFIIPISIFAAIVYAIFIFLIKLIEIPENISNNMSTKWFWECLE